ncbi:MAG: hypothetical protein SNF33_03120 [Candidatus Algichlamydia australiensis]|nr:hypothetical protein [Chlamydiales bacterium]
MRNCKSYLSILIILGSTLGSLGAEPYTFEPPEQISDSGQSAGNPEVTVISNGDAVAVWTRSDGFNSRVQGAQYSAATESWTTPVTISAAGVSASSPTISSDSSGNAVVVWSETAAGDIQSARYDSTAETWSAPIFVANGIAASNPQVSCDPSGNAVVVWQSFIPGFLEISASYFDVGLMTWSAPVQISPGAASSNNAEVSVDGDGDAVAVWQRSGSIQSSSFDVGTMTWSAPITISDGGSTVGDPQIGTSAAGDAIAVWERTVPSVDIRAARYTKGVGWALPVSIVPAAAVNQNPFIAVNDSLQAIASWQGFDGVTVISQASSYNPVTDTWSTPQNIDPGETSIDRDVAIDNNGNGVAVFERFVPPVEVYVTSFDLETNTWSAPEMVSSPGENVNDPHVAVASTGVGAMIVFTGEDGVTNVIEASTGIGSAIISPPSRATGKRVENRFPFQKEYFNKLNWTPSSSSASTGYKIVRNGEFLTLVSGRNMSEYRDHNRPKKGTDTYQISTIDASGGESTPVTVVIN